MSARSEPVFYIKLIPKGRGKKGVRIDLSNRILIWAFDDEESKEDKLTLTVDNWDLANFDTPVWKKGNIVEFQFGYVGNMSPSRQLVIKSVKGSTELAVEAYSKAFLINKFARCRVFEKKTRSQVVKQIAKEHGYGVNQQQITDTKEVFPFITQPGITDSAFIRQLTAKQGFEFYIDFDGFHWHKRKFGQRPIAELVWYSDQTGTLKDFKINNDISRQEAFVRVKGRDRMKKKTFTVDNDQTKTTGPALGHPEVDPIIAKNLEGLVTPRFGHQLLRQQGIGLVKVKYSSQPQRDLAKVKVSGQAFKRRALIVKMTAEIVGNPQLIAKSIIRIKGIGKRLSGNYYLKSHKHKGGDGYDGTLELIRDGTSENRRSATLFNFIPPTCAGTLSVIRKTCVDLEKESAALIAAIIKDKSQAKNMTSALTIALKIGNDRTDNSLVIHCFNAKHVQGQALVTTLDAMDLILIDMQNAAIDIPNNLSGKMARLIRTMIIAIEAARSLCKKELEPLKFNDLKTLLPDDTTSLQFKNLTSATGISAWTDIGKYSDTRGRR